MIMWAKRSHVRFAVVARLVGDFRCSSLMPALFPVVLVEQRKLMDGMKLRSVLGLAMGTIISGSSLGLYYLRSVADFGVG